MRNEYHIRRINAHLHPDITDVSYSSMSIEIEYGEAQFDVESQIFEVESTLQLFLHSTGRDDQDEDPEYGELEIEVTIIYEHEEGQLDDIDMEEQTSVWNEEGPKSVSEQLLTQLESGYISKIFAPLEILLSDSFKGLIPMYRFTLTHEEEEKIEEKKEDNDE